MLNKVQIIGNLCREPEIRHTSDNKAIANLSIATSESWKDKNSGQKQEKTEFHRVVIFGGLATVAEKYLKKGAKVFIEGKLQTRKWADKDGQEKYTTEIVVDIKGNLIMLGGKQEKPAEPANDGFDDDIPF